MRHLWKLLGAAAVAAAVVPYRVRKDKETGAREFSALLWQGRLDPGAGGEERPRKLDISVGLSLSLKKRKAETDPAEHDCENCEDYEHCACVGGEDPDGEHDHCAGCVYHPADCAFHPEACGGADSPHRPDGIHKDD